MPQTNRPISITSLADCPPKKARTTPLTSIRRHLARELATPAMARAFTALRARSDELAEFDSVTSLLAVLKHQSVLGRARQDRILRVLIAYTQTRGAERVWQHVLFSAFLPGLLRVRRRTRTTGGLPDEELDATLWATFLEVLHRYPLHRPGFVAAGILRDTAKAYFRALAREQAALEALAPTPPAWEAIEADADGPDADADGPVDRRALTRLHRSLKQLAPSDIDLVWTTVGHGVSLRAYMTARGLAAGDDTTDQQTLERLKQRRHRALSRLRLDLCGLPPAAAAPRL